MADQLVRSRTFYQASGTTLAITFTESTALDSTHLLVAAVQLGNSTAIATPAGWSTVTGGASNSTNQVRFFVKRGDGTTNGITFTVSSAAATVTIMAFSGYTSLTPLYSAGANISAGTSSSRAFAAGLGNGVALMAHGVLNTVTWGSWTNATRTGTIVDPAQRMDIGRAEYNNAAFTATINWTTSRTGRTLGTVMPLLSAPVITTTSLNSLQQNTAFTQTLIATGSTATWSVTVGTLPTGLSLSSSGVLSGTPTVLGSYSFSVTATNSQGSSTQAYTGSVTAAPARQLIEYFDTAWGATGTNSGANTHYKELVVSDCRVGDLLVVFGAAENFLESAGVRSISDTTVGGSLTGTWTFATDLVVYYGNDTDMYAGYATVTANGNAKVRYDARTNNVAHMGLGIYRIDSALVSPTRGFAAYINSSSTSLISTTLSENSMVIYGGSDWNAVSLGTTPTPSDGTLYQSFLSSGQYAVWSALWQNQAAGTRNYGPAGVSGTKTAGFTFYMNTPATAGSRWFTSTGTGLKPYVLTGSGLIEVS